MRFLPRHISLSPRAKGIACVLFSVLVWSGWMIVSSYSVRGSLTAYDITAIRFSVAGIYFLPILWRKGLAMGPFGWKGSFWLALVMGAPYSIITVFGMKYAPASHAAGIINTTMLTVTTLLGIFLLREKTTALRIAGIVFSLLGIGCMLFACHLQAGSNALLGHLFFILGGIIWAFYVVSVKAWKVEPKHAAAAVCTLTCLLYVPIYLLFIPSHIGLHNWSEVAFQALYQGVINSIFAMLCFNRGIALLGATTSSAFLPLVPVIATLLAIPALNEMPNMTEWAGIALAAVGVLLSTGIIAVRRTPLSCPADGAALGN